MPQTCEATNVIRPQAFGTAQRPDGDRLEEALGVDRRTSDALLRTLPFGPGDTTAGVENEIQAAVSGADGCADLALTIRESDFFENIRRMAITGDTTPRLKSYLTAAFLLALGVSQLWRFASEFLRADHRGRGKISAYQWMSLVAVAYGLAVAYGGAASAAPAVTVRIADGLHVFWDPLMLLCIQALWLADFLDTGRSAVTGATIEFHVHRRLI